MRSRSPIVSSLIAVPALALLLGAISGCQSSTIGGNCIGEGCKSPSVKPEVVDPAKKKRLDLLFAIDNSRSMADKQAILSAAVPAFVGRLVNPLCLDANGAPAATQPSSGSEPCPAGTTREIDPVTDIHIGVISSSIGGHGSDSCPDVDTTSLACAGAPNTTNNDKGHLLSRTDACTGGNVDTVPYGAGSADKGFLAWGPAQSSPPNGSIDLPTLQNTLQEMVHGVGQIGCGYESQLESIYRFLVDPTPYGSITAKDGLAVRSGVDEVVLQQRADFLRPDSTLAIVMLTDENDCSVKEYGQFWYVNQLRQGGTTVRMPRARQECAIDPNDPCCKSCAQDPGACPVDPTCTNPDGSVALLTPEEDDINLRCWDQKRRFGIDFLYPTDRYVEGFSSPQIVNLVGELVPNPIFSDLDPTDDDTGVRDPSQVIVAGIVGVPWQDLARDHQNPAAGMKSAAELAAPIDAAGHSTWDVILGSPATNGVPLEPLMIESTLPRTGTTFVTAEPLVDATMPNQNSINGHEYTTEARNLQYACIFPLPADEVRDCSDPTLEACDCADSNNDNPLCEVDPATGQRTLQVRAKAFPGIRPLTVLRDLGPQAVVASVCPVSAGDPALDPALEGYRLAMNAIHTRLKTAFPTH